VVQGTPPKEDHKLMDCLNPAPSTSFRFTVSTACWVAQLRQADEREMQAGGKREQPDPVEWE